MNTNDNYFPYPLISNHTDDYNNKKFEISTTPQTDVKKWVFQNKVLLEDEALRKLIQEEAAKYLIRIESKQLGFKEVFESFLDEFEYEIKLKDVSKRVWIHSYIIANRDLKLSSINFHSDYAGQTFNLKKGEILGEAETRSFIPEDDSEEFKDIGSIIKIVKTRDKEVGPISVGIDSEDIIIYLSKEDHKKYLNLKNTDHDSLLISMIVIPSLMEVLDNIHQYVDEGNLSEIEDRKWYKVLIKKIQSLGYSEDPNQWDSKLEVIQKIIDNQISKAMYVLSNVDDEEEIE
jgi:hypothetical protein